MDEALVDAVDEFEKSHPSVKIDLIRYSRETYSEKLTELVHRVRVAGGRLPDVLWIDQAMAVSL